MKKLLFFILLISHASLAQIKELKTPEKETIGKIAPMGTFAIELTKSGETYTFFYRDVKFTRLVDVKSFSFKDEEKAFDTLYNKIKEGFSNLPKDDIMLELPNDIIWLSFTKNMGVVSFRFGHAPNKNTKVIGFSQWLTQKQFTKLFGKE